MFYIFNSNKFQDRWHCYYFIIFCYYYVSCYYYFLLLLATTARFFLLKIEVTNKNRVICGMKPRLQIRVIYWTKYSANTFSFCSCCLLLLLYFYNLLSFFLPATSITSDMYTVTCACVCKYVCPCVQGRACKFSGVYLCLTLHM